ncbi:MAG: hypothetical protein CM15mP83_9500 [Flavobacteriaceae bacterium]|nr:MAG: hypothetical protein CM15mP83_9500 [Flavobacteriaceae bacterium]
MEAAKTAKSIKGVGQSSTKAKTQIDKLIAEIDACLEFYHYPKNAKIKISIGDRVYPLSVTEGQEAFLRDSAKQIEKMMKHYEQNYAVQDKQDVLAMCALQLALQLRQEGEKVVKVLMKLKKITYY